MSIFGAWKRLLFPEKCVICQKLLEQRQQDLCPQCIRTLPPNATIKKKIPFLSDATIVWYYEKDVRKSLLRFKFARKQSYSQTYGHYLAKKVQDKVEHYDVITWVPVSRLRKLRRGYDQVELITAAFCSECGRTPIACLKKIRHNRTQSTAKDPAQRKANVLGVYRVTDPAFVAGKRILLIDDIITTGATISECAKMLMQAGAKEVSGAAIAAPKQYKKMTSR